MIFTVLGDDGRLSSVGSTNGDSRSKPLNPNLGKK